MAKTKALISCVVKAKLICFFVFACAKSRCSHDDAHIHMRAVLKVCGHCLILLFLEIFQISSSYYDKTKTQVNKIPKKNLPQPQKATNTHSYYCFDNAG